MKKFFLLLSVFFLFSCSQETIKYTLTTSVNPADAGTVNPETRQYNEGDTANLIASPAAEYIFDKWTGASGTEETTIVMNSDKTVVANFVKKKYALTTAVEGEGTITEKIIKAGAATDYNSGTVIELTATPSAGWKFKQWNGDLTGTENPKEITIDKPKTVTAVFETLIPFYLDENGVTIKAYDWVTAGTKGELGGVTYTAVDKAMLVEMLKNEEDVSKVVTTLITDMSDLFNDVPCSQSATDDVEKVGVFGYASIAVFDIDISSWDVSNVTTMKNMFVSLSSNCNDAAGDNGPVFLTFNQDIGNWNVSKVTDMNGVFSRNHKFNQDIGNWNVSMVTDMSNMFNSAFAFNQDISGWDVSKVTEMTTLFSGATLFNQDINKWDVSKVTDMSSMFNYATAFNQDIGNWNTAAVTDMHSMFKGTTAFNQDIGNWNTAAVTDMHSMFLNAAAFNQDIGNWNVSNVTDMHEMFYSRTPSFNQYIGNWDVSKVTNMSGMFRFSSYNQDIGNWNVSNVTNMSNMFKSTLEFNQDISDWDVSNVIYMQGMFSYAAVFNQDIGNWNVSNVTDFGSMFFEALKFNQDLSRWCVAKFSVFNTGFAFANWSGIIIDPSNLPVWNTCPGSTTTWTSYTKTFTKSGGSDPNTRKDFLIGGIGNLYNNTKSVAITRGNDGGQIYNISKESSADKTNSPLGTTWAVGTIDQRESLTFKKFRAAVGKPKDVVGKDLVMYLEDHDVYLSVKFTSWTEGKNGGFVYERSAN
ncbi:BspA family leucine-rich repeat surface protein [Flavobacteriaceae bacterium]|nr:BspA family leucine-rich repeat surface protein [Flavobacteriaceae bacterium]